MQYGNFAGFKPDGRQMEENMTAYMLHRTWKETPAVCIVTFN